MMNEIRWMISTLNKGDFKENTMGTLKQDDEDWCVINKDPIYGEEGWVDIPKDV